MPVVPEERPEGCVWRVLSGAGVGYGLGTVLGAISANWSDLPAVIRDQPWPALKRTGAIMGRYGTSFALVGAAFSGTDCLVESLRGKTGTLNGMLGGGAAGAVLGARMGKLTYGVGAGFALAFTSALVDTTGGKLVGDGLIDDGATPPRIIYPYTHNGR